MKSPLLQPFHKEGLLSFDNRLVMSAMTRNYADSHHCATEQIRAYYERRALGEVGLIITEGVIVHPSGDGYVNVPHMHTPAQAQSWKPVIQAVQAQGSRIVCQLWHCGRISHPDFTGGQPPVSSSTKVAEGINRQNQKPYGCPHALTASEIKVVYGYFIHSAKLAMVAGFNAVELHLGHGYLADSFFDDSINDRMDAYGGSVENRCRFAIELTQAVIRAIGAENVMVRISPSRDLGGVRDWNHLDAMLDHLIPSLDKAGLRMLDISCARSNYYETSGRIIRKVRPKWPHLLLGGASLTVAEAEKEITEGYLDLVTWGRLMISNPDFGIRIRNGQPLQPMDLSMLKSLH